MYTIVGRSDGLSADHDALTFTPATLGGGDMAENDHLSNEVSVEVSVTENGAKASLKSRLAAAFDRLGGNLVDFVNIPLESANVRNRAKSDGERVLMEAVAKHGVQLLGEDPEFAKRAIDTHFGHLARTQKNKDAVLAEALEHLSAVTEDPNEEERSVPSGDLAPEFLDRFERYAAEASTDDLRSRWGRVLAREIQTPGAMSNKAMRIVDELDPRTAQLFENVCSQARVGNALIHGLLVDLKLPSLLSLNDAGLITYSSGGVARPFQRTAGSPQLLFIKFGNWVVSFHAETVVPEIKSMDPYLIAGFKDRVTTSVIMLTDAGQAVASILPDKSEEIMRRFVEGLHPLLPEAALGLYRIDDTGMSEGRGVFQSGQWTRF